VAEQIDKPLVGRVGAHGYAYCDNAADQLSDQNCIDIWVPDPGYWARINCGTWATVNFYWYVRGPAYGRDCTFGRYYRGENHEAGFHGTYSDSYAPSSNYVQCT